MWQPCCEEVLVQRICCEFKVQGFKVLLFVTYSIIQDIISSEMKIRTGPLNGQCKKK